MAMARTRDMVMWQSAFYATMVTGATKKGGGGLQPAVLLRVLGSMMQAWLAAAGVA